MLFASQPILAQPPFRRVNLRQQANADGEHALQCLSWLVLSSNLLAYPSVPYRAYAKCQRRAAVPNSWPYKAFRRQECASDCNGSSWALITLVDSLPLAWDGAKTAVSVPLLRLRSTRVVHMVGSEDKDKINDGVWDRFDFVSCSSTQLPLALEKNGGQRHPINANCIIFRKGTRSGYLVHD